MKALIQSSASLVCILTGFLVEIVESIDMECGSVTKNNIPVVLNGETSHRGDWPFIAALYKKPNRFYCGGTVLTTKHVLTAAHCIELKETSVIYRAEDIAVRLGAYNLTAESEEGAQTVEVSKIHVHHDWDQYSQDYDADIAILVLSHDVTFSLYIQPICLPDDDATIDNVEGRIVGWGYAENGKLQAIPRSNATKTCTSPSHCFLAKTVTSTIASLRTFSAGNGGGVPNKGDSGGGFFVVSQSRWVQYGIMSVVTANRTGHVTRDSFSVYTNVKLFKRWILEIIEWQIFDCLFEYFASTYSCRLLNIRMKTDPLHLNSSSNREGRTDDDVESIRITNITMFLQASRIGETFPNVKMLEVDDPDSSDSKIHLSSTFFKDLEHLVELKIKSRRECFLDNSFSNLPNLESIFLDFVTLTVLDDAPFHTHFKLREVYLSVADPEFIPKTLFENNDLLEKLELDFRVEETTTKPRRVSQEPFKPENLLRNLFKNKFSLEKLALRYNTNIDGLTFETNTKLKEVELTLSDVKLPWNLFENNILLEKVVLDFQLTEIDGRTFETNTNLKEVRLLVIDDLPSNLLKNNSLLEKFHLNYQSVEIDGRTFEKNANLKEVELLLFKVKQLPWNFFENNILLERVRLDGRLTYLESRTFQTNTELREISMELSRLKKLPWNVLKNNLLLKKVKLIASITEIDGRTFETHTQLSDIALGAPIRFIPWNLFKNNVLLENVALSSNITEIDRRTFETNRELKKVIMEHIDAINANNHLTLPKNVFKNNFLLETVIISCGLKTIDEHIFETNVQLRHMLLPQNKLEFLPRDLFKNNLLLEVVDVSYNLLKRIDVDFSLLSVLKSIDLSDNVCTREKFVEGESYPTLIYFQSVLMSQCQEVHLTSETSSETSRCVKRLSNFFLFISSAINILN